MHIHDVCDYNKRTAAATQCRCCWNHCATIAETVAPCQLVSTRSRWSQTTISSLHDVNRRVQLVHARGRWRQAVEQQRTPRLYLPRRLAGSTVFSLQHRIFVIEAFKNVSSQKVATLFGHPVLLRGSNRHIQELSYRKQIARQLRTRYVECIYGSRFIYEPRDLEI